MLARLDATIRLIIEICIATGARISEVLGLIWRHVNLDAGTIKIVQRIWHQDIGRPKSEDSKRILGIGDLVERLRAKSREDAATPEVFFPAEAFAGKAPVGLGCSRCSPSGRRGGGMRFPRTRTSFVQEGEHYLAATGRR